MGKQQIYHLVFSTYKRREILLNDDVRRQTGKWIKEICEENKIRYYIFKILADHVHILLKKDKKQNLSQIMQLIKGTSTFNFFIKYPDFAIDLKRKRLWTHGYYYIEIKDKIQYNRTIKYIRNNRDRFKDELEVLKKAPGFTPVGDNQ